MQRRLHFRCDRIKLLQDIEDWQDRPLDRVYPILFIDAVHFSVREDKTIKKLAAYVILGVSMDGMKSVLSLEIGENESRGVNTGWAC